jgi:hypothetical protein
VLLEAPPSPLVWDPPPDVELVGDPVDVVGPLVPCAPVGANRSFDEDSPHANTSEPSTKKRETRRMHLLLPTGQRPFFAAP